MSFTFFSKTDKTPKKPFFNSQERGTADSSGKSQAGGIIRPGSTADAVVRIEEFSRARILAFKPGKDPQLELENLLCRANANPSADNLLKLLEFLKRHGNNNNKLVNGTSKTLNIKPLDLFYRVGNENMIKELYQQLGARSANNKINQDIELRLKMATPRPRPR